MNLLRAVVEAEIIVIIVANGSAELDLDLVRELFHLVQDAVTDLFD
jgi:hypothetical protein